MKNRFVNDILSKFYSKNDIKDELLEKVELYSMWYDTIIENYKNINYIWEGYFKLWVDKIFRRKLIEWIAKKSLIIK